jgi:hypothetical protein
MVERIPRIGERYLVTVTGPSAYGFEDCIGTVEKVVGNRMVSLCFSKPNKHGEYTAPFWKNEIELARNPKPKWRV